MANIALVIDQPNLKLECNNVIHLDLLMLEVDIAKHFGNESGMTLIRETSKGTWSDFVTSELGEYILSRIPSRSTPQQPWGFEDIHVAFGSGSELSFHPLAWHLVMALAEFKIPVQDTDYSEDTRQAA